MSDLALCWKNVNLYAVHAKKHWLGQKTVNRWKLLNNVSGIAKSGKLCAIMGPSGSGKTTLLAALSQRNPGVLQGEIHLNGRPVDKELMIKMSGFVPQNDLVFASLTVLEHLQFMANLKMDQRVSKVQIDRIIDSICEELNLLHCLWTRLSQLSGGEMKRVSLAVQLLPDPPLLLCDEPTTGLDSYSASQVVSLLRNFAAKGKIVIASIHQPASGIFEMFDTVCLLTTGGRQAFFGDVDAAKDHFAQMGFVCPPDYNTAEYLIAKLNTNPDKLSYRFETSKAHESLFEDIKSVSDTSKDRNLVYGMDEKFIKFYSVQYPDSSTQLKWLLWRSVLDLRRNLQRALFKFSIYAITALLIALPYGSRSELDQEGIQNIQGLNYSVVTETIFTQAYAVMNTFPAEIPILLREIGNGLYNPMPYYLSKLLILLPRSIIETLVFTAIIYLVAGSADSSFFWFTFPIVISAIASSAYGCCISAMFENSRTASLLAVPFDFVSYTFSGLFLQLSSIPIYLSWLKYFSRFYYGLEAMTILQWKDVDNISCPENKELPCISNGKGVLNNYGYNANHLYLDIGGLMLMFFVLHLVGYIFFSRRSQKSSTY